MAGLIKVKMLRGVGGYAVDAERELSEADAKRLEARGVVRIVKSKAAPAPQNKAEPKLQNKAAG